MYKDIKNVCILFFKTFKKDKVETKIHAHNCITITIIFTRPNLWLSLHKYILYMLFSFFAVGSSNSSHSNPRDQNTREERLETHLEAEQSEDETDDKFIDEDYKGIKNLFVFDYIWLSLKNHQTSFLKFTSEHLSENL